MNLFGEDIEQSVPQGLVVLKSEYSKHQLQMLKEFIAKERWFDGAERNQSMIFGNLPSAFDDLVEVGRKYITERSPVFDQCIANHYQPGQGLINHVDLDKFEDGILILNLVGSATMVFEHVLLGTLYQIFLQEGDILILNESARYDWYHGIESLTEDVVNGKTIVRGQRISITLRKMKLEQD